MCPRSPQKNRLLVFGHNYEFGRRSDNMLEKWEKVKEEKTMMLGRPKHLGLLGIAVAFGIFAVAIPEVIGGQQTKGASEESNANVRVITNSRDGKGSPDGLVPSPQELNDIIPRKLILEPLPEKETTDQRDCKRSRRIEEVEEKIQNETDPRIRDRDLLLLAGLYVGQDDWEAARTIYEDLEAESEDPAVIEAVKRNLEVVELKLAILAETDPQEKELLEFDLANLHRDLGHEVAAKRMFRGLARDAREATIRSQAREMLSTDTKPGRPPIPLGLTESEQ